MKIKRSTFIRIVKEELNRHLRSISEVRERPTDDEEPKEKQSKGAKPPENDEEPRQKLQKPSGKPEAPMKGGKEPSKAPPPKKGPELPPGEEPEDEKPEVPDEVDPADEEMPDEEPDDESGGIADEITGKTVQSLTINPKSKVLPGAKEVIFTFNEVSDPLKLLLTQTGQIKFFYRGKLSDLP